MQYWVLINEWNTCVFAHCQYNSGLKGQCVNFIIVRFKVIYWHDTVWYGMVCEVSEALAVLFILGQSVTPHSLSVCWFRTLSILLLTKSNRPWIATMWTVALPLFQRATHSRPYSQRVFVALNTRLGRGQSDVGERSAELLCLVYTLKINKYCHL